MPRSVPTDAVTAWLTAAGRQPLLTAAEEVHLGQLVRAWQDHPDGPDGAPPAVQRRGRRARDRIVSGNLRLVAHVCDRLRSSAPLIDQLQAGSIGLIRAAEKFDPARGYKFSTYAFMWIRQGVATNEVATSLIHIPSNVRDTMMGRRNGIVGPAQLAAARMVAFPRSLDQPVPHGDPTTALVDLLVAPGDEPDLEQIEHAEACAKALAAMARADPDGTALLELHHGEGRLVSELAQLEGIGTPAEAARLKRLRQELRSLPEVERVLAA